MERRLRRDQRASRRDGGEIRKRAWPRSENGRPC